MTDPAPRENAMAPTEFDLIESFFTKRTAKREDVRLGIGDDCALLRVPQGSELAVSIDTLVEGVHFAPGADSEALGHKALAVGLSDLAAMGAEPAWATLAVTLPSGDVDWLGGFSRGFMRLARSLGVELVGGDTTRGPLSISVQVHGFVEPGAALLRSGASPGDLIYVTGWLGDAGLALLADQGLYVEPEHLAYLRRRLHRPDPRLSEAAGLRGLASAAVDLSDGLSSDLGHVLAASRVGATLFVERLPCSVAVLSYVAEHGDWALPLASGDDYELCFTLPEERQIELEVAAARWEVPCTWVGVVEAGSGLRCLLDDGSALASVPSGYDHFKA